MAKSEINPEKPVPTPEEVSQPLRDLYERQNKLTAAQKDDEDELRAIYAEDGVARSQTQKRDQVDALVRGTSWEPPASSRDRIAEIARRRSLLVEAQEELAALIRKERIAASKMVIDEFLDEQKMLAQEFWSHLLPAIKVHARFGEMKARLERAGVDTTSGPLYDFGRDLCGWPSSRTDHAAYAMRDAVRRGYIAAKDCPVGYGIQ
ncbi:MAG: hypothetical protein JNK47_16790 [Mesorhizobium sp.]|nr:hypothetical protein [Mesorhizobium sp.]MBL8578882.1 hypothetical protein [Mesorhizobium sp.]